MDYIFVEHPGEVVLFFQRLIKLGMYAGCTITAFLLHALLWPSSITEQPNMFDTCLRWFVSFRVSIFFVQIPVRWRLATMIWNLEGKPRVLQTQRLFEILETWEWTFCQITSIASIVWLGVTFSVTFWLPDIFMDQTVRRTVLIVCVCSVTVLFVQVVVTLMWLRSLLYPWVDNKHVAMDKFREHTDTFSCCQELIRTLKARTDKFENLPINLDPDTGEFDPMRGVQIYIPSYCGVCKVDFNLPSTEQEGGVQGTKVKPSPSERVTLLPCGHILHTECIECWIRQDHSRCLFCFVDSLSPRCWLKLKTEIAHNKCIKSS